MAEASSTIFSVDNVSRVFTVGKQKVHALHEVAMSIQKGEMILVEGKSGSGKTTLLNLLGGLDRASKGSVRYKGEDIGHLRSGELTRWRRSRIGFIFQAFALLPGLTAFENVDLAARLAGLSPKDALEQANRYLDLVGLAKRSGHRTAELSGGEQQRVAFSRGLVGNPEIVLADEPTGELDHTMSRRILDVLRRIVDEEGLTVCLTSHDPAVRGYAHRVYTLEDGRVVSESTE